MDMNQLLKNFYSPPPGYGEVAFFWWHGDRITKEKLSWILDQLKDAHLSGLQINYQNPAVLPFDAYPTQKGKPCWFRFVSPPGMKCMQLQAGGVVRAFCNGIPMQRTAQGFVPKYFTRAPAQIAVCVYQTCGHYAGAAISEPITFTCGIGEITVGDWSNIDAMRCYSGGLLYRKSFVIENTSAPVFLDLGKVVSAAQVYVNGKSAAVLVAPPFTADISQFVKIGKNCIEVVVNNTLANHMSTIPTIYQGSLVSGLLGHSE